MLQCEVVRRFWAAQSNLLASNPHLADLEAAPAYADNLADAVDVHYHTNRPIAPVVPAVEVAPIETFFRFEVDHEPQEVTRAGDYVWEDKLKESKPVEIHEHDSLLVSGRLNAEARIAGSQNHQELLFKVREKWPQYSISGGHSPHTEAIIESTRQQLETNEPLQPLFDYIEVDNEWRKKFGVDKSFSPEPWQLRMLEAISKKKSMLVRHYCVVYAFKQISYFFFFISF